jgi:hypothetical protein
MRAAFCYRGVMCCVWSNWCLSAEYWCGFWSLSVCWMHSGLCVIPTASLWNWTYQAS